MASIFKLVQIIQCLLHLLAYRFNKKKKEMTNIIGHSFIIPTKCIFILRHRDSG